MTEDRLVKLAAALCTGLMFGLLWAGGAPAIVFQLLGVGVSLMAGACVAAELL